MKGIGASPGIAIGRALVIKKQDAKRTGITLQNAEEMKQEVKKFEMAVGAAVNEIETIKSNLNDDNGIEILEVQIELLQDEQIKTDVADKIHSQQKNANDALIEVIETAVETFRNMQDEYFSARIADVQDAGNRILRHLNNAQRNTRAIGENTIIIAEDIAPSDTVTMDIGKVRGFATQAGGKTSHAAIIAKSKGIPAVVGCGIELSNIQDDDLLIIDGVEGVVLVHPSQEAIEAYTAKQKDFLTHATLLKQLKDISAATSDGIAIKLFSNISNANDMDESFAYGSEGCGLFRTEFLFMSRDTMPSEEEQFIFYKEVALKSKGKPVVVRTLDIGGDKQLPYLNLPAEQNPFLGYRAIRISLDRKNIFITQLKSILRAGVFGQLKIMLPMISNLQEIKKAKGIFKIAKDELRSKNIPFAENIELGIMIEIPSAALTADILAKEVDFFSIGTNDLCQYTLAVDRMNEQVKHLYDPFNPAVLRLIQLVIEQGKKHHVHVGMCGELAGDPLATRLLLGMGLKEFSMSAASIPYIKEIIIKTKMSDAEGICKQVMAMEDSQAITNYLTSFAKQ